MNKFTQYKVEVAKNATLRKNVPMENTGPEHARIIMSNIFRTAKKYVYIFAGNLNGDVSSGEYLFQLEEFINRGGILKVVLEYFPPQKSQAVPLILKYQKKFPKNIFIGRADVKALRKIMNKKGEVSHFTIADDRMHRLEQPEKRNEPWRYIAIANFNDSFTALKLKDMFNMLEYSSQEIEWQPVVETDGRFSYKKLSLYKRFLNFIFNK